MISDRVGLLKILTSINLVARLNTRSSVNRDTFQETAMPHLSRSGA